MGVFHGFLTIKKIKIANILNSILLPGTNEVTKC